ncbi:MAG: hypothetical protein M3139_10670 [Bacteroidota bacterium]|nr:hypothetical protein [Bacteroidota bacterium]
MQKQLFFLFQQVHWDVVGSFISSGKNNFTGLFGFLKGLDKCCSSVWFFTDVGFLRIGFV